jgi:hypothetical protein
LVSRVADHDPDGLTKVAQDHGFAHTARQHHGLLGRYGGLTGALGVLVVLGLTGGVTYAVRRRRPDDEEG